MSNWREIVPRSIDGFLCASTGDRGAAEIGHQCVTIRRRFATISLPIRPLAPGRLSTITCCFQLSVSLAPITRARISDVPPARLAMTKRIGFAG
jgi:hypothetical protein